MGPSRREPPRYWPRPRPDITTLTADGAEPPIRAARRVQLRGGAPRDERGVLAVRRARSEGANEADGPFSPRAASLLARPHPEITNLTADGPQPPIRAARRVQLRGGARRDERGVLAVRRARSECANETDGPFSPRAASLLAPTAP